MVKALFMKDVRLTKKNLAIACVLLIGIPIAINWRIGRDIDVGAVPLLMMVTVMGVILYGNMCVEEEKNPGGEIMLLCTPCSKRMLVTVRYLTVGSVFLFSTVIFEIVNLCMGRKVLSLWQILQSLAVFALVMGFFIPVVYKMGVMKIQYIMSGSVVVICFGSSILFGHIDFLSISGIISRNRVLANVSLAVVCIIFILVSYMISVKIYEKKECG